MEPVRERLRATQRALSVRLVRAATWGERHESDTVHAGNEAVQLWAEHVAHGIGVLGR